MQDKTEHNFILNINKLTIMVLFIKKNNTIPSLSNELNFVKLFTYISNRLSIICTLCLFLYNDRKSTNNGGTPLWKPALKYESISLWNAFPKLNDMNNY